MRQQTQKIKVTPVSYEDLVEQGFDIDDNARADREFYGKFATKLIMRTLTAKQRRVVICLSQGMKREEIANHLMVSTQEIHQIILRIRQRLKAGTQYGRSQIWSENRWR